MTLADRIVVMREGRIAGRDPLEIYNEPANQFVAPRDDGWRDGYAGRLTYTVPPSTRTS